MGTPHRRARAWSKVLHRSAPQAFPSRGSLWNAQTLSLPLEGKVPPKGAKEEEAESF